MITTGHIEAANATAENKWLISPVKYHEGKLASIGQLIPRFERQDFAMSAGSP
jgi:hypothetical protein